MPGEWVDSGQPYKKTLYNPEIISDETMMSLAREALLEADPFITYGGQSMVQGEVLYNGKIVKFEGWLNADYTIKSYYPVIEWSVKK